MVDTITNMKLKTVWFIVFTFVGSYLTTFMILPLPVLKSHYTVPIGELCMDILTNLLFCIGMVKLSLFVDNFLNRNISWMTRPWKRLLLQVLLQITGVVILVIVVGLLYLVFQDPQETPPSPVRVRHGVYILIAILFLTLTISTLNTGYFLLGKWKDETWKAMEYKLEAARNRQLASEKELQALKLQLDAHFVFNNLSALSELISKDQQLGYEYTENFTKVYRYLLVNSKNKLIPLSEEIKFLRAYRFLIKHRIGDGCRFYVDIDESGSDLMIPPLTLQLLIENALKHNRTEADDPLEINIDLNADNELEISNKILPVTRTMDSTGMGLKNICDRYALLGDKMPVVEKTEHMFKVKIPLLQ